MISQVFIRHYTVITILLTIFPMLCTFPLTFFLLLFYFWLHWVFVAVLGPSLAVLCGLLPVAASLAVQHGPWERRLQ